MEKLLYINNYHCTNKRNADTPNNHLWGADDLSRYYDVTCANVPSSLIKFNIKGAGTINNLYKSFVLLIRYFRFPIVYAACGELCTGFALSNLLHLGKRSLFQIQHHGCRKILFSKGYTKLLFISPVIANNYTAIKNKTMIVWGGDCNFIEHLHLERVNNYIYDFISAGKTGRDYTCMIEAAKRLKNSKFVIITDLLKKTYSNNVEIISGDISKKNSISADDTFRYYNKSKFIVIPVSLEHSSGQDVLAGLTSFVDAAVMGKPVLISDNTNMGIDVKKLGIGLIYP